MIVPSTEGRPEAATEASLVSLWHLLGFVLLFAALKLGGATATTVLAGLLCLWALVGRAEALKALSLMTIAKSLNADLFAFSPAFGLLAWLLLILAGLRIVPGAGSLRAAGPVLLFCVLIGFLCAVQDNRHSDISAMKLVVFGYGAITLLVGFMSLDPRQARALAVWLASLTAAVVVLSLAVLPFPGIGYGRYAGFRGILGHPQTLGPVLAPFAAWLLAGILFQTRTRWLAPGLAAAVLGVLMVLSGARTAVVTVVLALVATFLSAAGSRRRFRAFRPGRSLGLALAVVVLLGIGLGVSDGFRERLTGFVFKYHSRTLDAALASRSGGIVSQWEFFTAHPLIGNGFGVYPWGEFPSGVVRVMGIPISAPVEKGFLPTAILEEVGLVGTAAFLYLVTGMTRRVMGSGDPRWLALFFACLFVNVGEMVFFSIGGIGLYFWLLMGLAVRMGAGGLEPVARAAAEPPPAPFPFVTPTPRPGSWAEITGATPTIEDAAS